MQNSEYMQYAWGKSTLKTATEQINWFFRGYACASIISVTLAVFTPGEMKESRDSGTNPMARFLIG